MSFGKKTHLKVENIHIVASSNLPHCWEKDELGFVNQLHGRVVDIVAQPQAAAPKTIYIDRHRGRRIVSNRSKAAPPTLPPMSRFLTRTSRFRETYADQLLEFVSDAAGGRRPPRDPNNYHAGNEVFIVGQRSCNVSSSCTLRFELLLIFSPWNSFSGYHFSFRWRKVIWTFTLFEHFERLRLYYSFD